VLSAGSKALTQDNLLLASAAFGLPVVLLFVDREEYLN
jgi:hypothetical protein